MRLELALVFLATFTGRALSQETLSLNGSASATLPPGGILLATATLPPGTPAVIAYDVSPGPVDFFGDLVPLGFTPALGAVGSVGIVPASGIFVTSVAIPDVAFLVGSDFYLCALALDPTDPNGVVFSTGATLHIRIESSAGRARAGFTGEAILLDGGANASSAGALAAGDTIDWQIVSAPVGSVALLAGSTTLYPTLTPDLPGEYVVEAKLSKSGIPLPAKPTKVTAFKTTGLSLTDGQIKADPSLSFDGTLAPADKIASLKIDGSAVAVSPGGSFAVPALPWLPGQVTRPIELEVTTASGDVATQQMTILQGTAAPVAPAVDSATQLRITKETFALVAALTPAVLTQSTFNAMVNIPPQTFTIPMIWPLPDATITIDPSGGSYSTFTCAASTNGTDVVYTSTMTNVKVNFNFSGTFIFTINTSGSATANVTLNTHVKFYTPTSGPDMGLLKISLTSDAPQISGLSISLGSIPSQLTSAVSGFVNTIYTNILSVYLKPQLESFINMFVQPFNLQLDEMAVNMGSLYKQSILFTSVVHSVDGMTAVAKTNLVPDLPPTGPNIAEFVSGEGPLDPFGPTIPELGGSYNWGTAITVDGLNALLAKFTKGGIVNKKLQMLAGELGLIFGSLPFTAAELAALLPSAGFECLPAGQLVEVILEATTAPIVKGNATESKLWLDFAGVKAKFMTKAPGSNFDIEFLKLNLETAATMKEKIGGPKFNPELQEKFPKGKLEKGMPSAKKPLIKEKAPQFAELLPKLVESALQKINLPGYTNPGGFISKPAEKVGPNGSQKSVAAWVKFQ